MTTQVVARQVEAVMDSFAPELFRNWLPVPQDDERAERERRDEEARRQQQALQELAERVSLARTIV